MKTELIEITKTSIPIKETTWSPFCAPACTLTIEQLGIVLASVSRFPQWSWRLRQTTVLMAPARRVWHLIELTEGTVGWNWHGLVLMRSWHEGPQAISRQAWENHSWHSLAPPCCVYCEVHAPVESEQKVRSPQQRFVPACATFGYFDIFLCVAWKPDLTRPASGLDGYVSHWQPLLRITALIRWPRPSFLGSSPGHSFLFPPAVHIHHIVLRHLVAVWQEEQSAPPTPNYQPLDATQIGKKETGSGRPKGVANRVFISHRFNNTCRRQIIVPQWRRLQICCYPQDVCQQVGLHAARCRGALRRQRVKIVHVKMCLEKRWCNHCASGASLVFGLSSGGGGGGGIEVSKYQH